MWVSIGLSPINSGSELGTVPSILDQRPRDSTDFVIAIMTWCLDKNSATSILAGLATSFLGTSILFVRFGPRMRRRSQYVQVS
jgi:hypothetical protein